MDPTSIVEDTERTWFCPQTDRRKDRVKPVYPPFNFVEAGGIMSRKGRGSTDLIVTQAQVSGGRLNKKDGLTRYGNSHVKDKTS